MFKKLLIVLLFLSLSSLKAKPLCTLSEAEIILYRKNIDIDSKSIKGWLRIFNSPEKLRKHDIFVTPEEAEIVIKYLKKKYIMKTNKYKKVVR